MIYAIILLAIVCIGLAALVYKLAEDNTRLKIRLRFAQQDNVELSAKANVLANEAKVAHDTIASLQGELVKAKNKDGKSRLKNEEVEQ